MVAAAEVVESALRLDGPAHLILEISGKNSPYHSPFSGLKSFSHVSGLLQVSADLDACATTWSSRCDPSQQSGTPEVQRCMRGHVTYRVRSYQRAQEDG
jgi:hypothetical protein